MNINNATLKGWSRLGQRGTFFGVALPEIAKSKDNIKVLTADLALMSGLERFAKAFPEMFYNVGIAEQNMIGIASGMAMEGDCVFATTYSSFIVARCVEQIRQHLSYMKLNVKIVGTAPGVAAARAGVSHWATEDLSFMRSLPNMTVFSPADALEAHKIATASAEIEGPFYIRLGGGLNTPIVYSEDYDFKVGKAICLMQGEDVALLTTGLMVAESLNAAKALEEQGVFCSVYNFHTIKPIDIDCLDYILNNYKLVVTVEEHSIIGGLGGAVAEYKSTKINTPRQVFIGFPDTFDILPGSQRYMWNQIGLTEERIANRIKRELNGENND